MDNLNLQVIKKIHEGIDDSCYAGLLKLWDKNDFNDKSLSMLKQNYKNIFQRIMCDGVLEREVSEEIYSDDKMYDIMLCNNDFFNLSKSLIENNAEDCYFTLNSFWTTKKTTEDVRHLNAIVMDFDFYKMKKYKNLCPKQFYETYIQELLPFTPTVVMDSGRGLYVIFSFKHCSYHLKKLYRAICNRLLDMFIEFGMDPKALNITQVIRVPATINTKTYREVQVIEFNDTQYTIQSLSSILKYSRNEVIKYKLKRKNKAKLKANIMLNNSFSGRKRKFSIFYNDCVNLVKIRNKNNNIIGIREYLLFIVRERAVYSGYSVEESIEYATVINNLFNEPLTEYEVIKRCRPSVRQHITSLEKIMKNLDLQEEEMLQMVMLKTKNMKMSDYQKRKRKNTLLNLTKAEIKRLERRKSVLFLRVHKKMNVSAIARELGISRATVQADLKFIKNNPSKFMIRLEEYLKSLSEYCRKKEFIYMNNVRQMFILSEESSNNFQALSGIFRSRYWEKLFNRYIYHLG